MKKYKLALFFLFMISVSACQMDEARPVSIVDMLTDTKWQLIEETGLNLPKESLNDNIIELSPDGQLIYYLDKKNVNVFTKNEWKLSADQKKIVESLPDGTEVESEILVLNENILKVRYQESDGLGGYVVVTETYQKFVQ